MYTKCSRATQQPSVPGFEPTWFEQIAVLNQISSSDGLIGFSDKSIRLAFHNQLQPKMPHLQVLQSVLQTGCGMDDGGVIVFPGFPQLQHHLTLFGQGGGGRFDPQQTKTVVT